MREILTTFIVALCSIGVLSVSTALGGPIVSVDPPDLNGLKGETFTVNITIDPQGEAIYGAQYDLYFDPAVLQVVSQTKGDFLTQDGASSIEIVNTFNNTIGRLEYSETRIGTSDGVTGAGVLAMITFNLTNCGSSDLTLSNVILANTSAQPISGVRLNNSTVHGLIRGDLAPYPDGNCVLNMGDVIRLLNYIHDEEKYPVNEYLADLNLDGEIDVDDVMLLLSYVGEEE
ncbi:MAG: secreted protein containing Cellulosome anchoring protein, cohesin region domain protein [Candidatus Syntrophoarchaeum caldarius]|uniref:Secreted protein containing Cellulosome anchoring protein, cohesin region domain protein n=1 Tax=Candidatus Syntropharchaeum caldarium TaxID=1838285 RepID=A0A1F2PCU4_9EURY|nr:MAG: secreted protein containing Cellulosome anchoring protein, cohesin region domain protein [Candidatus Syntrophoarchaeum caldarius]